jgi:raffinose/stachyose/melibiose transport system substrate-binding protein
LAALPSESARRLTPSATNKEDMTLNAATNNPRRRRVSAALRAPAVATLLAAAFAANPSVTSVASAAPSPAPASFATNCGTKPITMLGYFETGFPDAIDLAKLFTKQHPNVKWDVRQEPFAALTQDAPLWMSGPNAPDLIRIPTWSGLVKDHLLKNMDGYYKTFGWDKFPASDLAQLRVAPSGTPTGVGPLWGMGINYSMTGVFYNKALAAKIGMTSAPKTLAQFDALLAKAKSDGLLPVEQFNSAGNGGLIFPLQYLMADYNIASSGSVGAINKWVFDQPKATFNTPANLKAVEHLDQWIKDGYFNSDANAVPYETMMSRFEHGQGVFIFDGDWESGNFDSHFPGKYGFFLFPPLTAGGKQGAMSAPLTYGISATAKYANCAAYFLNWVATNPAARELNVVQGGSNPGGPPNLPIAPVKPGTVTAQTLAAGNVIAKDDGAMGFIANATGSIDAEGLTPAVQKLFAGQETPTQLLQAVQAAYKQELSAP